MIWHDYLHSSIGVGSDVLVARTAWARWFESSIGVVSGVAIILTLATVFAPAFQASTLTESDRSRLQALLAAGMHGESGYYALMADKHIWFDDSGSHAVAYHCQGTHCVALEPLGEPDEGGTMWQFQEVMTRRGYQVIWYGLAAASLAPKLQRRVVKIGESAVIRLQDFTLQGAKIADVRHAVTHIEREHVTFSWYRMDQIPYDLLADLEKLMGEWQHTKHAPRLTFTLGFYPFPLISEGQILLAHHRGVLTAVLSFYPSGGGRGMVLDLMVKSPEASNGTIEAALAHAALHFQAVGFTELNLGMAPLADVTDTSEKPLVKKIRNVLFDRFNKFYQYKSLYRFKNKFVPEWQPRYLYVPDYVGLPAYLTSVMLAHLKTKRGA
jgi:phosphatidylglycerol lysyltransferase